MGIKLLPVRFSNYFYLILCLLSPVLIFGQACPSQVTISANPGTTICAGTSVTFTANASGGTGLEYHWQLNGSTLQSETGATYTTSNLSNSDKIKVVVSSTDDASCSVSSNTFTMTVNAQLTPSLTISATTTNICPGDNIKFTASPQNGGTNPSYKWKVDGSQVATGISFTTSTLTNNQVVSAEMTSNAVCVTTATVQSSNQITVTVNPGTPGTPGSISGSAAVCPGTSETYSVNAVTDAAEYIWTLPAGWTGSSTGTSITVNTGSTGSGAITVKAKNSCGTSGAATLPVSVKSGTPATPGTISGNSSVCPGVSETYTIANVSGATKYIWILPSGWTGSSTTNSITVTTGTSGSGNITVKAENDCGTSAAKTYAVTLKPGTPATPVTISGTTAVCPGTSQTYSIANVSGASEYIWTLPNGWTGSSTTNSITVTSGTASGSISVKAKNDCGTSNAQTLALTVKAGTPAVTGTISGSTTVCPSTTETFSIISVTGATEYIWTLPSGWTGTSNTNSITVTTGNSGNGNISVQAKNDCGTSTAKTLAVSIKAPAPTMTGTISGNIQVCLGSAQTYTIPAIANATDYVWTVPSGWTINSGSTTNSINVTAGATGNISVIAKNSCGDSSKSSDFAVQTTSGVPATPGQISNNLAVGAICPPASGITFSATSVSNATGYNWILPAGWEITSGANTNAITVKVNSTAASSSNASVSVTATNICGSSASSTLSGIAVASHVAVNAGADIVACKIAADIDIDGTYSFGTSNANLKPMWTTNGSGSFGNDTKLTTTYRPSTADLSAGQVKLTLSTDAPNGACGPGMDELIITFKPDPTASISGTATICSGSTSIITFTGTPNSQVTYKIGSGSNQTINIGASGSATLTTAALTASTTYSLVSVQNATAPSCPKTISGSAVITVTQKPTATIFYAGSPICKTSTSALVTISGSNGFTGGVYSSTAGLSINSSTGAINASNSTAGTYTVTYTIAASGGCQPVVATTQVTITAAPTAVISYNNASYCKSLNTAQPVNLTGTNAYTGGTYSAPAGLSLNATTGAITPSTSTPGNYTVTYETPASAGCAKVSTTTNVVITAVPTATISYANSPFCISDTSLKTVTLNGTGAYQNGTYSSTAGLTINANTGEISANTSTPGSYLVTYKTPDGGGCTGISATANVTITQTPAAEISYNGPFCQSDTSPKEVTFSNTVGAYQNGKFSSDGTLTINENTGAITPSTSQTGEHTIIYTIPASGGCPPISTITTKVTITAAPKAKISYSGPFCTDDGSAKSVIFSDTGGAYTAGVFSATSGLAIAGNGDITPSSSSAGVHSVYYTIPAGNGCEEVVVETTVEIFEKVQITNQPINVGICSTQPASFEVVASGDNLTYLWKRSDGAAIKNATGMTTNKLSFNNATATNAGEYYVEVSGSSPCGPISSDPVTLNVDENIVIIKPQEDEKFCDQEKTDVTFEFIAHANGAPLEFTWLKDNVELNIVPGKHEESLSSDTSPEKKYTGTLKIINPNPNDNGVYAVRIKGPDYFTCADATSKTFILNVNPLPPNPSTAGEIFYCQGETAVALAATGESGATFKWYESETGNDLITDLVPSTNTPGTSSYWVSQTTGACESHRTELKITVKPKPAPPTTNQSISYCLNTAVTDPLTATGDAAATINWYASENAISALASAPIPNTSTNVVTNYWVSQTLNGCESDRVKITITINALPILTATADQPIICIESSTNLKATGADSYSWSIKGSSGSEIGTGATLAVTPLVTTTYILKGTNTSGCSSTAEVTVTVEEKPIAGFIAGAANVCISSNTGNLTLSGHLGNIINWEKSTDGITWAPVSPAITSSIFTYTNLTQSTWFRAEVKNGSSCATVKSPGFKVTVDPLPKGGELAFGDDRVFMVCENPTPGYARDLTLQNYSGTIVAWKYRASTATQWTTISFGGIPFTGTSLSAAQIESLNISQSSVFRVEVSSGSCTPNASSRTAIFSVIPSDIEPTPVTVEPTQVCLGEEVTLSSETGYSTGNTILDQGAFDNASITQNGWRVRRNGNTEDLGFDTDANNTRPDRWKRATRHQFTTASISSPYTISESNYISSGGDNPNGNKGFAVVSSNNSATMETPVFNIGPIDQAILTFDQAYNLTPGASIKVEISVDGGNSYSNVLYSVSTLPDPPNTTGKTSGNFDGFSTGNIDNRPNNKIRIDLGNFLGQSNLRIRFSYIGIRIGDFWAIDNIDIPEGPAGVTLEWYDYSDPENPVYIGNNNSENWAPKNIGWNTFEVRTLLLFDTNGQACQSAENFERIKVFVFDKYTSTATASEGNCGSTDVKLSASLSGTSQGEITEYPTLDGYTGAWTVTGPAGYTYSDSHFTTTTALPAINDPNATFSPGVYGAYTLTWNLTSTAKDDQGNLLVNTGCVPIYVPAKIELKDCTTLDFDGVDDYVDLGDTYTGNYSIEAWIKPEAANGTIISGPGYELSLVNNTPELISTSGTTPSSSQIVPNSRWYHLAVSNGKIYIDGIETGSGNGATGGTASPTFIGARYNATNKKPENYFSGWIEELRIWNTAISQDQIKFLMNQRLQNNANMGVEIPMAAPGGLTYNNLEGYYQLIVGNITGGYTPDLATNAIPGRMRNMDTFQENTAPLPYTSRVDGQTWFTDDTWTNYPVWDAPNSNGVTGDPIEWNIVKTSHNITSGGKDIKVLGLKSEVANKKLSIETPGFMGKPEENPGQILEVTHYLKLDGIIDLVGESQLLQGEGSILEEASKGYLERDQQGTRSSYNYNYWCSIVSPQGGANNSNYNIAGILLNGTDSNNPAAITFVGGPYGADNAAVNTSTYWLWRFHGLADDYASWIYLGSTGMLQTGEGFTMKGTSETALISERQNYVFRGKPNNGTISNLTLNTNENYLIGNPYPSALDANEFLLDNLKDVANGRNSKNVFNGALYFWDHFGGSTHILREYIGGYAIYNLSGGVKAITNDERVNIEAGDGSKIPEQYIPVGQGFFVITDLTETGGLVTPQGGQIVLKNSQRAAVKEGGSSIFLSPEKLKEKQQQESRAKIRITFNSPKGYHRQILATADAATTNGFDLGYDAPMAEDNVEDMFWVQDNNMLVIQGVPNFDLDQELPLGIKLKEQGEFSIQIDTVENAPRADFNVYLYDITKDSIHNLKESIYTETAVSGILKDRFKVIFYKEEPPKTGGDDDELIDLSVRHGYQLQELQILNSLLIPISKVYLFDLNGKLIQVFENIETEKEVRLKLKNFSAGVYVVKLISNDKTITRKIIIPK